MTTPTPPTTALRGDRPTSLTPREIEVMDLIAQGYTTKKIAAALGMAYETVRNHITAIYARLGAVNRANAVALWRAREAGE